MAAQNNIPDLQVFGKGRGDFKLPYGYVDGEGRVFNRVYLREMTGVGMMSGRDVLLFVAAASVFGGLGAWLAIRYSRIKGR